MNFDQLGMKPTFISSTKFEKKIINCLYDSQAIHVCSKEYCDINAFLCQNQECQCKQDHLNCFRQLRIGNLQRIVNKKIQNLKQIEKVIKKQIYKAIDQLSQFGQTLQDHLQDLYNKFNENQSLIMSALNNGQVDKINGNHIFKIQKNIQKQNQYQSNKIQKQIVDCWNSLLQKIQILKKQTINILFQSKETVVKQFKDSSILKSNLDIQNLTNFFEKKIKKVELLYRATRDSFKISQFHEKCDNIPDTLTIIQTTKDKIIGGYTQLMWTSSIDGQFECDNERKSFLFQLNNNHKFTINPVHSQQTIYNQQLYGPTFGGGHDIFIHDHADENTYSQSNIGFSYQNSSYIYHDAESQDRFSGGKNFTVKDYEVWKIIFA